MLGILPHTTEGATVVTTTLAASIRAKHQQVHRAIAAGLTHAKEAGRLLIEARQHIPHGGWIRFVEQDCGLSRSIAAGYMRVFRRWDENVQRVAHLPLRQALALLADGTPHVAQNGGNNEWYTPKPFIDAARQAMGSIDTDPATSDIANATVGAETAFTAQDDGLKQVWHGNVWMNPPYAQPAIQDFAQAVSDKFDAGEIDQACALVNNATETAWFQRMLESASAICLVKGRVRFLDQEGKPTGAPLQGQAVVYLGRHVDRFMESFAHLGPVTPVRRTADAVEIGQARTRYIDSRARGDAANRLVENVVLSLQAHTDPDMGQTLSHVDVPQLDPCCLAVWAEELRKAAREINRFAARLEKASAITEAA